MSARIAVSHTGTVLKESSKREAELLIKALTFSVSAQQFLR